MTATTETAVRCRVLMKHGTEPDNTVRQYVKESMQKLIDFNHEIGLIELIKVTTINNRDGLDEYTYQAPVITKTR